MKRICIQNLHSYTGFELLALRASVLVRTSGFQFRLWASVGRRFRVFGPAPHHTVPQAAPTPLPAATDCYCHQHHHQHHQQRHQQHYHHSCCFCTEKRCCLLPLSHLQLPWRLLLRRCTARTTPPLQLLPASQPPIFQACRNSYTNTQLNPNTKLKHQTLQPRAP